MGQRQVEAAAQSIRRLASRVGPVIGEGIPREIRRHQWSALNVPLLWAAAEDDRLCPHDSVVAGGFRISLGARRRSPNGKPRRRDDGLGVVEGRDAKH